MVARRLLLCVPTVAVCFALFPCGKCAGGDADHPNRSTQPDMAVGQIVDSIFDFEKPKNRRPTDRQRASRRRHSSRHSSLQGKLVNNPRQTDGSPPFALVDRYGGVLRYIEPVDHIDLDQYVGQTVGVRRDTGDTLLASQLALSPTRSSSGASASGVQLVNFEEIIAPGEIIEGPVVMHGGSGPVYMPSSQEPVYLDDGLNFGGCPDCGSYVGCGSGCRTKRRRCDGVYFGYELTVLRPFISGMIGYAPATIPATFDDAPGFGHRFIVGYDGGKGLGARVRYWFYNHGHDFSVPIPAGPYNSSLVFDMDVADLEFTLDERIRNWELILSGGVRYSRIGLREPEIIGDSQIFFEGAGPTVSLEAIRGFGSYGFYLVGNFRASLLLGDWHDYTVLDNGNDSYRIKDESFTVFENQLGIGYTRKLPRASLTLRTVWETQFWLNDTFSDVITGISSNVAFGGPTATAELRF